MARVDILLPYWGDFSLLKKSVESVRNQTVEDWRLVVADDCYPSTQTADYFEQLHDTRIIYIRHKKNIGVSDNFNYCIDVANAEHCVILGCDDILLPNYLETALKNIGYADFYQPKVAIIDTDGNDYLPLTDRIKRLLQPRRSGYYSGERLATSLCYGNWLYFPSIMWRTETIKRYRFNSTYKVAQDLALELNMIADGAELYFDKQTTFKYRRFSNSVSSKEKTGVRFNEEKAVYDSYEKKFEKLNWTHASRAARLRITSRLHSMLYLFNHS